MEETPLNPDIHSEPSGNDAYDPTLCSSCQDKAFVADDPSNLCSDCREAFLKYPIPGWLKMVAIAILAAMLGSLFRLSKTWPATAALCKAETAMEEKNYLSASRYLRKVVSYYPKSLDANAALLISAIYTDNFALYDSLFDKVEGRHFDDQKLYNALLEANRFITMTFPQDSAIYSRVDSVRTDSVRLLALASEYSETNPEDYAGMAVIANALFDIKCYEAVERILEPNCEKFDAAKLTNSLLAAAKRNLGKYDEAISCCQRILDINKEDVPTIAQMARIELKRRNDQSAALFVNKAMELDPENIYALEAKALYLFLTGKKPESESALAELKKRDADSKKEVSERVASIIHGLEKYR